MDDLRLVVERNGDLEEAHFAFSYTPVRDVDSRVAGLFCACTETTAQVLGQRRLRESEERQRLLIEGASDYAMFTVDLEGRITSWSGGAVKIFGLAPEEAIGQAIDILYTPEDRATGRPQHELATAREEGCANDERWHQRADGSRVYMNGAVRPLHGEAGQLIGFLKVARDETERRRYTDVLERNERQFREMADAAPVMLWVTDADGVCTYLNRPWYAFTGQSQAEAEGFGWLDATHDDDKERAGAIFVESNARRESFYIEYRLRRADGSYAWAIDMATPRFAPDGTYLGYVGSVIDISSRHEAEEALRRSESQARETELALRDSEARFRAITDSVDQMIWSTLPDGHHDYFNRRWYEYTGVPDGSTDGDGWNGVFHPDDQQRALEVWTRSLETGRAYHIEYRLRRNDGQYRWVLGRAQPVRDEDGRIIRWFGTCTDIQEIVEARELLARSRQVLEEEVEARTEERDSIWRISQDLFVICGFDGLYRSVNPAWREALGYPEEELVGARFDALVHPEDVPVAHREFGRLVSGQVSRNFDLRVRASDGGYRWYSWTCIPAEGEVFYAAGRDVTESKELESQLRQAQKMEAVGQLTGGIAHDFNNLLQIVVGNLELAQRNLPEDSARLKRSVTNAMTGAKRAAVLTERLLAFSRRQPLAPKPVSANKLVAGMSELLGRSLGETIQVETVLAGGLWRVEADPNQLENAIVNLAVNARDAMPDGGKLTIETANTRLDESYAHQNLEVAPGKYVVICVSDTGTGMNKEALARAFEPFFTTKGIGKGTGLGLSQVYGFVKQSGGHVKIYSEPGDGGGRHRGTTVKIYLPRFLGPGEQGEDEPEDAEVLEGGLNETILVVEDDPDVRAYTVEVPAGARLPGGGGGRRSHRAKAAARRRDAVRPAVHRRGPAGRDERRATGPRRA
jgi:PAS domain S-box-containing protein